MQEECSVEVPYAPIIKRYTVRGWRKTCTHATNHIPHKKWIECRYCNGSGAMGMMSACPGCSGVGSVQIKTLEE